MHRKLLKGISMAGRLRVAAAVVAWCLAPRDAFAYVDPGSGLVLIQGLLALIGGILVFVRHPIDGIKRLWERLHPKSGPKDK